MQCRFLQASVVVGLLVSAGPAALTRVEIRLSSPQHGQVLPPGQVVDWQITAFVDSSENLGLASISCDLSQDPTNPRLFDLPAGRSAGGVMSQFDLPEGFANPHWGTSTSRFGGTRVGQRHKDLAQIGGGQNTFGVAGPCLGPNGEICVGQDTLVERNVGHGPQGQAIAQGSFRAPAVPGTYSFELSRASANVLAQVNAPPQASVVAAARVVLDQDARFSFTVQ